MVNEAITEGFPAAFKLSYEASCRPMAGVLHVEPNSTTTFMVKIPEPQLPSAQGSFAVFPFWIRATEDDAFAEP